MRKMIRKILLLLSVLSIGYYAYSYSTVMADLPFTYQVQNVFTIVMCSVFAALLFVSNNKELLFLLNRYYCSFSIRKTNDSDNYTILFCFMFLSYAHYYLSSLFFRLILDVIVKISSLDSFLAINIYTSLLFAANCLLFVVYAIPVVRALIKRNAEKTSVVSTQQDE
ncbi:hypothetical protein H650_21450 [Enterobacter sp. R4-368]|nr:hypothetical protein H650_21450 [Enterobacter sp. R4-368]